MKYAIFDRGQSPSQVNPAPSPTFLWKSEVYPATVAAKA
jgi:hypothetical protein